MFYLLFFGVLLYVDDTGFDGIRLLMEMTQDMILGYCKIDESPGNRTLHRFIDTPKYTLGTICVQ